jgi:hypothetical protein
LIKLCQVMTLRPTARLSKHTTTLSPGQFRIFAFDDVGHFKPFFKSDVENYVHALCVYHHRDYEVVDHEEFSRHLQEDKNPRDGHYDAIKTLSSFFGAESYCLSCEKPYDNASSHTAQCKSRCMNCTQVGPTFPCKPQYGYNLKCDTCNKTFYNEDCHNAHIEKNTCHKIHKCDKCGIIYNVKDVKRHGGHVCGETFCHRCKCYHAKRGDCFIRKLEPPSEDKEVRYILFDFETTQK